jgi:hypothetical protein
MFILEILLGLKSMQGDVTCASLHADLEENKTVYVDMPMGFTQYGKNGKKCLKLKKTLYGLRQSPRAFWRYIMVKLKQCDLEQLRLIHVYSLEQMQSMWFMLMTLSFGQKMYH